MTNESQLGAHLDFRNGRSSPSRNEVGRYNVFGSNGVIGRADQCNADAKTIIVGRVGTYCGSIHFSSEPCWVTDNAIIASAKKPEEARFWYLLLQAYDLNSHRAGSGQPLLNQSILNSIKVSIPEEPTRLAIACILSSLDDKIELNRRMNETLEAMARAIFRDWFVDFGPTRAKMEGRKPYLAPDIWSLFPDRLDYEGKPEGWEKWPLATLTTELRRGISPSYVEAGGVRVLNQKCIRDHQVSYVSARRHDISKRTTMGREIKIGDILVNSTGVGTLGRVAQVWEMEEETTVDSHITLVRPDSDLMSPILLGLDLIGREPEIELLAEGSTGQTELSRIRLGQLSVLVPARNLQENSDYLLRPLLDRVAANRAENQTLAATRDLLLPKLMSGEIRIKDAEKLAGEAT